MYIRDARNKYDQNPYKPDSKEPNPYYEGYLDDRDAEFIKGYDWCIEEEVTGFFDGIDIYDSDIDPEDFDVDKLDYNFIDAEDVSDEEIKNASRESRILRWMKDSILMHIECSRDEIITSMLDNMDEEEYEKNYKAFWEKENKIKK